MADKKLLRKRFTEDNWSLEQMGQEQKITRERVRQLLNKMFGDEYKHRLKENRLARPFKSISFKNRICLNCGKIFSGKEPKMDEFTMCKECRREEHRAKITVSFICKNCGKEKEYIPRGGRRQTLCSNKCKMEWIHKLLREKRDGKR